MTKDACVYRGNKSENKTSGFYPGTISGKDVPGLNLMILYEQGEYTHDDCEQCHALDESRNHNHI